MDTPRPYPQGRRFRGAGVRIGLFGAGLLLVFGAAVGIGSMFDPADTGGEEGHGDPAAGHGGEHGDGYSLRLGSASFTRGEEGELSFTIVDADERPVREFDELHERRMHLIVVRRDGTGFRHLHPDMDEGGTWSTPVEFGEAGVHRAFADFSVAGKQRTLAADLTVGGGDFAARPFPPPASVDPVDGYEVRLRKADPVPGGPTSLVFAVTRDGVAVDDLSPYLGAMGHLVALREGDLAFLHVHPQEAGDGGGHAHGGHATEQAPGEIAFATSFPSAGRYRLYLQFRHRGAVRTAEFTVSVPR